MRVPVIDLFAGPGGLGEGFSRADSADFRVVVSIEKDEMAFETLRLRAAHRSLTRSGLATPATWLLWDSILAAQHWNVAFDTLRSSDNELIVAACEEAREESWNVELVPESRDVISAGIRSRLNLRVGDGLPNNAVLIGGPPCQAYSVAGRSRNRGTKGYRPENDHRHFLYREYLDVISEFRPALFIMENVKGILTSKVDERQIFQTILEDLRRPDVATGRDSHLEYELISLSHEPSEMFDPEPSEFIVESEIHGVPQARHRVIICGVRSDVYRRAAPIPRLALSSPPTVRDVLSDLPRVRSALSFRGLGADWLDSFDSPAMARAVATLQSSGDRSQALVARRMISSVAAMRREHDPGPGSDRVLLGAGRVPHPAVYRRWYRDRPLSLIANHMSRSHMPSDLVRYLFVSAFGEINGFSPRLQDFPKCLLPKHRNVNPYRLEQAIFKDRFRVQVADTHSMTITSHIAKDGHAFIHHDPTQCRSLTVREAARLQGFPDSYVFLGNRTSQYTQVGNAVPPYLARQIAQIVGVVLQRAKLADSGANRTELAA
jgi:DNA (cytosine-5)-methyltransferase 1